MGFASVRGDLEPVFVCGMELHLSLIGAWAGAISSNHGWIDGAHRTVGGARTSVRERVELGHN